ncbi:dual specificity protein phosphatase 19 isoform X1 [Halichoerus grypus]
MHSLNQEIKAFSRNNLRKQCTRVTTLTGKKIIETWKDARIHVVEEVEPSSGGSCGYVQDLSLDLHVGVIKPWLLLGSQDAAHDLDTLKKYKVTHILNVAYGVENAFLSDFIYKSISILDLPETNILSYFPECFEFIEQAKMKRPSQGKSQAFSVGQQNSSGLRGAVGQEVEAEVEKLRAHEVMAPRESEEVPTRFLLLDVLEFHNLFSFLKHYVCLFVFKDFIYLFERERMREREHMRGGRVRGRSRLPAGQGAQCGTRSRDSRIMT